MIPFNTSNGSGTVAGRGRWALVCLNDEPLGCRAVPGSDAVESLGLASSEVDEALETSPGRLVYGPRESWEEDRRGNEGLRLAPDGVDWPEMRSRHIVPGRRELRHGTRVYNKQ